MLHVKLIISMRIGGTLLLLLLLLIHFLSSSIIKHYTTTTIAKSLAGQRLFATASIWSAEEQDHDVRLRCGPVRLFFFVLFCMHMRYSQCRPNDDLVVPLQKEANVNYFSPRSPTNYYRGDHDHRQVTDALSWLLCPSCRPPHRRLLHELCSNSSADR